MGKKAEKVEMFEEWLKQREKFSRVDEATSLADADAKAKASFWKALGISEATLDKFGTINKGAIAGLQAEWVEMASRLAAADRAEALIRANAKEQVDAAIEVLTARFIESCSAVNKAVADARDLAYLKGQWDAKKGHEIGQAQADGYVATQ